MSPVKTSLSIGLLCLLAACGNSGAPNSPGATAILPTAAPFPTPTALPADPLPQAAAALQIGDYDSARAAYTSATSSATQAIRCAAWYGLGATNQAAGDLARAEAAFTSAIPLCNGAPLLFRAYANRGEVRRAADRPADAIADYRQALAISPGLIDSYLYERIAIADQQIVTDALPPTATASNSTPDPSQSPTPVPTAAISPDARIDLQKAVAAPRYLAGTFALRAQLASDALAVGDPKGALAQYDQILTQATDPAYRARIEVEAGDALAQSGQAGLAYQRYTIVITTYPTMPAALDALIDLINANQLVNITLRTQINIANDNYTPIVNYLPDYLNTAPPAQISPSLVLWLGEAQAGLGQTDAAVATLQRVQTQFPPDPAAATAALDIGHTYFLAKRLPDAIAAYLSAAAHYPNALEAPEALSRAALLAQENNDPAQAVTIADQLSAKYPTATQNVDTTFAAGQILYASDLKRAADFFARSGDARGLLWQGKALKAAGDVNGARQAWTKAGSLAPGTFFSLRAHDLLSGTTAYTPANAIHLPNDTADDQAAAERWIAQTFALPNGVPTALSPTLAADPGLRRGTELQALGWTADARAEFNALQQTTHDDPAAQYQLAVYFRGVGAHSNAIIAATRVIVLSKQAPENAPAFLARLAYPIYYAPQVIADAKEFSVDPLLFASLIRLESNYDPTANSISDARGLTQIVPSTAQDIVSRLNWPPNYTLADLYRPLISLRMGAYYFDYVRRYVGGDPGATLAGYNAGMGYASSWAKQANGDLDMLYQTIDIGQAQDYIRYTYEYDTMYHLLYGG